MSMLKVAACTSLLWLSVCNSPGMAQEIFIDGRKLDHWCSPNYDPASYVCRGYVMAVVDVMATNHVNANTSCVPTNTITPAQAVGIVKTWLRRHWQLLNLAADDLAAQALHDAFPCE